MVNRRVRRSTLRNITTLSSGETNIPSWYNTISFHSMQESLLLKELSICEPAVAPGAAAARCAQSQESCSVAIRVDASSQ